MLSARISSGTAEVSSGSPRHTTISRLFSDTACAISRRHGMDLDDSSVRTNRNASEVSIPSHADRALGLEERDQAGEYAWMAS